MKWISVIMNFFTMFSPNLIDITKTLPRYVFKSDQKVNKRALTISFLARYFISLFLNMPIFSILFNRLLNVRENLNSGIPAIFLRFHVKSVYRTRCQISIVPNQKLNLAPRQL